MAAFYKSLIFVVVVVGFLNLAVLAYTGDSLGSPPEQTESPKPDGDSVDLNNFAQEFFQTFEGALKKFFDIVNAANDKQEE